MDHGRTTGRVAALDGLRGLAALEIVLRHQAATYQVDYHPLVNLALGVLRHGPVGHPLFFVLTGFGMARLLKGRDEPGLGSFLVGRWRRLAPPYYVAMALCLAVPYATGGDGRPRVQADPPGPATIADHALFLHALRPGSIYAISPPLWSMSLTWQFVLIVPLLHVAMTRRDPRKTAGAILLAWLVGRGGLEWAFGPDALLGSGFVLDRLPPFLLGMLVGYGRDRLPRTGRWSAGLVPIGLIATVALQESTWGWPVELAYAATYAWLLLVVLDASERGSRLTAGLGLPVLARIGTISYALYLTHDLILSRWIGLYRARVAGPGFLADLAMIAIGVGLALAFARVFFERIERPSHEWAKGCRPARVPARTRPAARPALEG